MKIQKDKRVAISYELQVEGRLADKATAQKPLEYIHGAGMLLPRFEAELEGKEPGDDFAFVLSPTEGYGEVNPQLRISLPKRAFEVEGVLREDLLKPGTLIPMQDDSGHVVQGRVEEVGPETVIMDFNHPMAGKTLHFTGKVLSVSDDDGSHHCCHGKGQCHEGKEHGEGHCCEGKGHCKKDQ